MTGYFRDIKQKLLKKVDARGLAVFRMFYTIILFSEVSQLKRFAPLVYNDAPFFAKMEFVPFAIFMAWQLVLILLFLGLFTRFATIINYMFSVVLFSYLMQFEYHAYFAFIGVNFFMLFMPISRVLSFDSLLEKLKYSNIGKLYKPMSKVYAFYYFIPVFVGVGIVYFDSTFYKVVSEMWMKGLGMWKPANISFAVWNNNSFIMNNEIVVKFLGYLVVVFEAAFIFIMWYKKLRIPLLAIGVFFHLGILVCYPIPWFALAVVALYILMVPIGFWKKISFKIGKSTFTFYYDAECPLCVKTIVAIKHFDIFEKIELQQIQGNFVNEPAFKGLTEEQLYLNIYGVDAKGNLYVGYNTYVKMLLNMIYMAPFAFVLKLPFISNVGNSIYSKIAQNRTVQRCTADTCFVPVYAAPLADDEPFLVSWLTKDFIARKFWKFLIITILILQCFISFFSALPAQLRKDMYKHLSINKSIERKLNDVTMPVRHNAKLYLGLLNHPVFMDGHFDNYNHIFRYMHIEDGVEKEIPIIDKNGMAGPYINGAFWVNYTFRVLTPDFEKEKFNFGIKKYLMFWLNENGKDLQKKQTFNIYVKEIAIPKNWEKDCLNNQIKRPWQLRGKIIIENGNIETQIDSTIK